MSEPSYGPMLAYFEGQADPPGMEEECPSCGVDAGCWCAVMDGARGAGISRRMGFLCVRRAVESSHTLVRILPTAATQPVCCRPIRPSDPAFKKVPN